MTPQTPATSSDEPFVLPLCAIFRRSLKRAGLKFTPERAKILDAVLSKKNVFEAEALLYEMRQSGHQVSKATIYRTLKHLMDAKIISEVLLDAKQAHYQLTYGKEPKGHLVCVETNRIVEFDAPELMALRKRICKEHGFDPVTHRFVIYGVSPEALQTPEAEVGEEPHE
ncbi:MAG: transcriptional repressor [Planctomycetes bacterium]|nr:transcriptional repressor [Planctomycetota bacterium]